MYKQVNIKLGCGLFQSQLKVSYFVNVMQLCLKARPNRSLRVKEYRSLAERIPAVSERVDNADDSNPESERKLPHFFF